MTRLLAFLAAMLVSLVAISSATASEAETIHFRLNASRTGEGRVHASFRSGDERHRKHWSTDFRPGSFPASTSVACALKETRPSALHSPARLGAWIAQAQAVIRQLQAIAGSRRTRASPISS